MNREETLNGLRQSPKVDVCVIGGGINGVSVFRELTLQGLNVLLVEKHDYCSGASAALSRMVHGGLRYLENGEFKLVRESLAERDRLLRNAPHYVAPLPTTVPVFDVFSGLGNGLCRFLGLTRRPSRRGAVAVKTGLTIYDFLTRQRALMPRHQFRGRRATLAQWPAIHPGIKSSATYYDAWVSHPERLGIEVLQDGLAAGSNARALNYASLQRAPGGYAVSDGIGGGLVPVEPALIINATGGWIDLTNRSLFPAQARPAPLMGGTKGSHLIIRNAALSDALAGHMIYYENEDGRICILFPYLGNVLVGSTDIRVDDPETARCEEDERDYILQSLAFVLPDIRIRPEEIVFQFSGVRPLPVSKDSFTGRIPRDHFCTFVEPAPGEVPVLCMIGGKWTTFRSFGELAADMVLKRFGKSRRISTTERPIGGGRNFPQDEAAREAWLADIAAQSGLSVGRIRALFARYGTGVAAVAKTLAGGPDEPVLASGYSARELRLLIETEAVEHLDDLLLRRTTLAITGRLSLGIVDAALAVLAGVKGWTEAEMSAERTRFLAILRDSHGVDEETLSARNEQRSLECETTEKSG